jgi:hypothetical protein
VVAVAEGERVAEGVADGDRVALEERELVVDMEAEGVLEVAPVLVEVTEGLLERRDVVDGLVLTEGVRVFVVVPVGVVEPLVVRELVVVREDDAVADGLRVCDAELEYVA